MFNPASLRIKLQGKDNQDISPFVGIRKATDGEIEFCLPFGFDDFPIEDFQRVTKFFFSLYKTFQHFQEYAEENFKRKSPKTEGSLQKERGFTFISKDDESVTLSSKIANLESVLAGYDELRIFSIIMRPKRTDKIDYAQISKYLHQAVFLKNHVPYIDEMILPQPFIEYSITDLVRMYCFVYLEIKRQLEEYENTPIEIINQAELFRENNLQPDSSLFSPNHDFTVQLLRSELDQIHHQVSLKDDDYWHFYKALEDFLYGVPSFSNDGVLWGITSFALIWEDMCIFYMYHNDWDGVWFADSSREFANTKIHGFKLFLDSGVENPFYFKLNNETRNLRPDLVRSSVFDATSWFTEGFIHDYPTNLSCRITLRKPNNEYKSWFDGLDRKIKSKFPGTQPKSKHSLSHIYKAINKIGMDQVINEIKNERLQKRYYKNPPQHIIVDFKYVSFSAYELEKLPSKISNDIKKQIIYEYAINLNAPIGLIKTKSQFCVPVFSTSDLVEEISKNKLNRELKELGIEILKINYPLIQTFYNSHQKFGY